jgi:hypothetical protein
MVWYANGKKLFPNDRIIELKKKFIVYPNKDGNLILSFKYPGKKIGISLTILLFVISLLCSMINKKFNI